MLKLAVWIIIAGTLGIALAEVVSAGFVKVLFGG